MVNSTVGLVFSQEKLKYGGAEDGSFTQLIMPTKPPSYHKVESAVEGKNIIL